MTLNGIRRALQRQLNETPLDALVEAEIEACEAKGAYCAIGTIALAYGVNAKTVAGRALLSERGRFRGHWDRVGGVPCANLDHAWVMMDRKRTERQPNGVRPGKAIEPRSQDELEPLLQLAHRVIRSKPRERAQGRIDGELLKG